jgi:hypothetical protein
VALRTAIPRCHGTEHATPCCRIPGCVEQSFLPEGAQCEGASSEDERTQFVKEHPNFISTVRSPVYPAGVSSSLHGALPASAARTRHGTGVFFRFFARASRF